MGGNPYIYQGISTNNPWEQSKLTALSNPIQATFGVCPLLKHVNECNDARKICENNGFHRVSLQGYENKYPEPNLISDQAFG